MTRSRFEITQWESEGVPTVIAFDPGGTTGWAVMSVHPDALSDEGYSILENITHRSQGQIDGDELEQIDQICEMVDLWEDAAVLFEDFQLRTAAAELSPVRITATVNYILQRQFDPPRPLFLQMPVLAMSTATDDRLNRWGLYQRGAPHARDATRHAITFMRRAKEDKRIRELAWPGIFGSEDAQPE